MRIQGPLVIDVSKWNDHLNIKELEDGGVVSVILGLYKSYVNGQYVLNTNCHRIADQIAASNLIFQSYFYYYPQNDPIADADWYVNAMKEFPIRFAWADCENFDVSMTALLRSEQNRRFADRLHTNFPKSGVYTAKWYTDGYCTTTLSNGAVVNEMDKWLPKYAAWMAQYNREPKGLTMMTWNELKTSWLPDYDLILSKGQLENMVVGHQFTGDRCLLPGVYQYYNSIYGGRMAVDVNVFKQEFLTAIQDSPNVPPTPPPPVPATKRYVVISGALNIRSAPIMGPNVVRVAVQGDILQVLDAPIIQNGYVKLIDGNWAAFMYLRLV